VKAESESESESEAEAEAEAEATDLKNGATEATEKTKKKRSGLFVKTGSKT
jgi:hypothetical protein